MSPPSETLSAILANTPDSWLGTTFPNDGRFVGRQTFMDEMIARLDGSKPVTKTDLEHLYPEDYLRLGSPPSTLLEVVRARETGYHPYNVFCFSGKTMPLIVTLLAATGPVYVYGIRKLLTEEEEALLHKLYGCEFTPKDGALERPSPDAVIVEITDTIAHLEKSKDGKDLIPDAVIGVDGFVYIADPQRVLPGDIQHCGLPEAATPTTKHGVHTMRKRLTAPYPTPDAMAVLKGEERECAPDTTALCQHLKELGGCANAEGEPLITTVGLAALYAAIMGAYDVGGGALHNVMCSTSYGGSSQQTDILSSRINLQKFTYSIQGAKADVLKSITESLDDLAKAGKYDGLTMLQVEYPTNPDMKHTNLDGLEQTIEGYTKATGSQVVLLFDTTFSPTGAPAKYFKTTPLVIFNSLSKSVSGGFTTGGSLVANATPLAQQILERAHVHARLLDNVSRGSQLRVLSEHHSSTEERIEAAHAYAAAAGKHLEASVLKLSGQEMKVNFVTEEQIALNVRPATYSFNLPVPAHLVAARDAGGESADKANASIAGLAQDIVDRLVEEYPEAVKPCVSFGQDNTLVYVTVPATSTQGVISEADKAKQAVGGVQLVRFSFPPKMDLANFNNAMDRALERIYKA